MLIHVLKSKLKEVTVTAADVKYRGSPTLDPLLMAAANLFPYERVEVNAVHGKDRLFSWTWTACGIT